MKQRCYKCGEEKELKDFFRDTSRKLGVSNRCKICSQNYWRVYKRGEKYRIGNNKYQQISEKYKFRHRKAVQSYSKKFPERIKAHQLVKNLRNKLVDVGCVKCGVIGNKLHLHHPDYHQPYLVIPLCIRCHEKEHHDLRG